MAEDACSPQGSQCPTPPLQHHPSNLPASKPRLPTVPRTGDQAFHVGLGGPFQIQTQPVSRSRTGMAPAPGDRAGTGQVTATKREVGVLFLGRAVLGNGETGVAVGWAAGAEQGRSPEWRQVECDQGGWPPHPAAEALQGPGGESAPSAKSAPWSGDEGPVQTPETREGSLPAWTERAGPQEHRLGFEREVESSVLGPRGS